MKKLPQSTAVKDIYLYEDKSKLKEFKNDPQKAFTYVPQTKHDVTETVGNGRDNTLDVDEDQQKDQGDRIKTGEKKTDKNFPSEAKKISFPLDRPLLIEPLMQTDPSHINMISASVYWISPAIEIMSIISKQIQISTPDDIKYFDHMPCTIVEKSSGSVEEPDFNAILKYLSDLYTDSKERHRSRIMEAFDLRRFRVAHEQELSRLLYRRYCCQGILNTGTQSEQADMRYEAVRLRSFRGVDIAVSPLLLVATGFYATGHGDETRCFSCRIIHRNWTSSDNPVHIHAVISPTCSHVTDTDDNNVSIQCPIPEHPADEEPTLVDGTSDTAEQRTVCTTPSPHKHFVFTKCFNSSFKKSVYNMSENCYHQQIVLIAAIRSRFQSLDKKSLPENVNAIIMAEKDYNEPENELTKDSQGLVNGGYDQHIPPKEFKNGLDQPGTIDYSDIASENSTSSEVGTREMDNDVNDVNSIEQET